MNRFTIYTTAQFGSDVSVEKLCEQLWQYYFPKLSCFIRQRLGDYHTESADLCQEILTKVLTRLNEFNPRWAFSTWLYQIARNHLIDYQKSRSNKFRLITGTPLNEDMLATNNNPEDEVITNESVTMIKAFIEKLQPVQREVAFLRFSEELNSREIGKILDLPDSTVRYHIHTIRKELKLLRNET